MSDTILELKLQYLMLKTFMICHIELLVELIKGTCICKTSSFSYVLNTGINLSYAHLQCIFMICILKKFTIMKGILHLFMEYFFMKMNGLLLQATCPEN